MFLSCLSGSDGLTAEGQNLAVGDDLVHFASLADGAVLELAALADLLDVLAAEEAAERSWLSEAWLAGYLTTRGPITLTSNVGFLINWPGSATGIERAADLVRLKKEAEEKAVAARAAEAAKQAGRAMLPHVALPLNDFAAVCKAFADFDVVLFFYEGGGAPLREVLHPGQYKRVAIVTGSEGGFSVEEAEAAKAAGAVTVGLGPRILRCETAPLAALTSVMLLTGNLE